jgi:hypothetical protein
MRWLLLVLAVSACSDEDSGPPPIAKVPGKLGTIAVNNTSIFAIDTTDDSIIELGLDGTMIGKLPTVMKVTDLAAAGDIVGWVEVEGSHQIVQRRKAGVVETLATLTFAPKIVATTEGIFYSDTGIIARWGDTGAERLATPAAGATLLGVDASFVYTLEGASVQRYDRRMDMKEEVVATTMGATVKDGYLAYRTADGVRIHDLFTKFDALFGMPPAGYECNLLIAGRAVMCGQWRCLENVTEELIDDPVTGYTSVGKTLYWAQAAGTSSEIFTTDAEQKLK